MLLPVSSGPHGHSSVWHGRSSVQHGRVSVPHGHSSVRYGRVSVRHGHSSVRHGRMSVRHGRMSVRHGRMSVRHGRSSVRHGRSSVRHGRSSVRHDRWPLVPTVPRGNADPCLDCAGRMHSHARVWERGWKKQIERKEKKNCALPHLRQSWPGTIFATANCPFAHSYSTYRTVNPSA